MEKMSEKVWAHGLCARLELALQAASSKSSVVKVRDGFRLPYALEVLNYKGNKPKETHSAGYQTDLLVYDVDTSNSEEIWVPRVVVECKTGGVTTHDALTYSSKAATHRHVHPYLRYGILIGNFGTNVPSRLIRHGQFFDFMTVWEEPDPTDEEWQHLIDILVSEIRASRILEGLLTDRTRRKKSVRTLHRPLIVR